MKAFRPKARKNRTANLVEMSMRTTQETADQNCRAMGRSALQAMINDSPAVRAEAERHAMIYNSPQQVAQRKLLAPHLDHPVQRQEALDEEELLQGRFAGAEAPIQRVKFYLADYTRRKPGQAPKKFNGIELDTADPKFANYATDNDYKARIKNELLKIAGEDMRRVSPRPGTSHETKKEGTILHYDVPSQLEKDEAQDALDSLFPSTGSDGKATASKADASFKQNKIFQPNDQESAHDAFYRNINDLTAKARAEGANGGSSTDAITKFLKLTDPSNPALGGNTTSPNARHNRAFLASRVRVGATSDENSAWGSGKDELLRTADTREFIRRDAGLVHGIDSTSELDDGSLLTWMDVQELLRAPTDALLWTNADGTVGGHTAAAKSTTTDKWMTSGQDDFHKTRAEAVLNATNPVDAAIAAGLTTIGGTIRPGDEPQFGNRGLKINSKKRGDMDVDADRQEFFAKPVLIVREKQKRRLRRFAKNAGRLTPPLSPERPDPRGKRSPSPDEGVSKEALESMFKDSAAKRTRNKETEYQNQDNNNNV